MTKISRSGVKWNAKKIPPTNSEAELLSRKAVKFKFKRYKDYLRESKAR